jgi:FAD:protein FMN transferase
MLQTNIKFSDVIERAQPWLGTIVSIRANNSGNRSSSESAINQAFACIADIHRKMSFHAQDSELSLINRRAFIEPQQVSHSLYRVLQAALSLAKASDGIFDPTVVAKLVERGQLPAPIVEKNNLVGNWRDIALMPDRRVQFLQPLWIDLGGIAKGYAVDEGIRVLKKCGIHAGTINAGGDMRSFGGMETIHVRDPACPQKAIPILHIRDAAAATSAGYFSEYKGNTALVNSATGLSVAHDISITVVARRAIWADALTKVVAVLTSKAAPLLQQLHASALILHKDGSRHQVN